MASIENIKEKDILFFEGDVSNSINILMKGDVSAYLYPEDVLSDVAKEDIKNNSYKILSIPKNMLLGVDAIMNNLKYTFTFIADNDISMQRVNVSSDEIAKKFFTVNKTYTTYMIRSLSYTAIKITDAMQEIDSLYKDISTVLNNLSILFWSIKDNDNYESINSTIKKIKDTFLDAKKVGITLPKKFSSNFIKKHDDSIFNDIYTVVLDEDIDNEYKLNFYKRLFKIPADTQEKFFSFDTDFALMFSNEIAKYISYSAKTIKSYFLSCNTMISELYSENDSGVLNEYFKIASAMKSKSQNNTNIIAICNFILNYLKNISSHYSKVYENDIHIDIEKIEKEIEDNKCEIEEKEDIKDNIEVIAGSEKIPDELKGLAKKIIDFSEIEYEKAKELMEHISEFRKVNDKLSTDDNVRHIRKGINSVFFNLYLNVAKKVVTGVENSRIYEMFLDYAFLDEELLSKKNIVDLYNLKDESKVKNEMINIYSSSEYLKAIYNKDIMPSITSLGKSYEELLKDSMRRGEINEDTYWILFENQNRRLEHEISNMLSNTQKLCYGQISSYSSILHDDMIIRNLDKSFISKSSIEDSINNILKIDFSAFYREVFYRNQNIGIEKEMVMEEVVPNFVLSPTYGTRSIMWQDINGRDRKSKGKILVPILTSENLEHILINSIGAFRWEICKSVLGYSWNDVSIQSLTSEYYDYVTFHKRNRDLGEEAREKFIVQLKKARNNMRDVFVGDYFAWIRYESESVIRLNKVARAIMYRNVPFSKELRHSVGKQPIFSDLYSKFEGMRKKKVYDLENRYMKYTKGGGNLPKELSDNILFYKNM